MDKFPIAGNSKVLIFNGSMSVAKLLVEADIHKVLGMHIIGPRAMDLITKGMLAIVTCLAADTLIVTIHSYPTVM